MVNTAGNHVSYRIPSNKILQNRRLFYGFRRKKCESADQWLKQIQDHINRCDFPPSIEYMLMDCFVCGLNADELTTIRNAETWTLKELVAHYFDGNNSIEPTTDECNIEYITTIPLDIVKSEPDEGEYQESVSFTALATNENHIFDEMKTIKIEDQYSLKKERLSTISNCSTPDADVDSDLLEGSMKFECEDYKYSVDENTKVDQIYNDNPPLVTNGSQKSRPRKIVDKKRAFACDECDKSFKYSSYLSAHREHVHLGIRTHVCEHCDKNFLSAQGLKQHAIVHSGDHPFTCDQCDKTFTQVGSLTYHKKSIHQKIRTHSCSKCPKRFFLAKDLASHVLTHTGVKPYPCDKCDQSFSRSNNLKRHKSTVHLGIRPHKCTKCDRDFTSNHGLKKHLNSTAHERIIKI